MHFVWPAALLGLLALAVPLLIHMLARGEFQQVAVATTRFVRERHKLRWRRRTVSQPLLLALRMLLVTLCVLLLAEPYRQSAAPSTDGQPWTLVSTRVDPSRAATLAADTDAPSRWLAPGFPSIDQPRPDWQPARLWSLLHAADQIAPPGRPFVIIAPTDLAAPGPVRPALARPLRWLDAGPATPATTTANPLDIDIVYDAGQRQAADDVARAINAWQDIGIAATSNSVPTMDAGPLATNVVWLSASAPPDLLGSSRVIVAQRPLLDRESVPLTYHRAESAALRAQHADGVDVRVVADLFTADGAPHPNLARELLNAFLGAALHTPPTSYPVSVDQFEDVLSAKSIASQQIRQPLSATMLWLIAIVALLERLFSALARRSAHDA